MADLEQAQRFLSWLDPSASEFAFQTFDDRPKAKRKTLSKLVHGDANGTLDQLTLFNDRGAGIFVTINETDGAGRSVKHIKRVRCIFVDLDGSPLEPVLECDHRPHCVIETSPGKYQAYWRVDDVPLEQFTNIQRAFARKFKGDNVIDLSRVMRVPGFDHKKGEPFEVRIVSLDDDEPSYHISEILTEVEIEQEPERHTPANGSADPFLKAIDTLEIKKGGWHDAMRTFTGSMVSMGHSPKVIERLAASYTWPGYSIDDTLKEVRVMVNGARSKGWAPEKTQLKPLADLAQAHPAPPFPTEALPKLLRKICEDDAKQASCPVDFFAIPRLVEIAGCIGSEPRIRPLAGWQERICLWGMVIADPGSMKSNAISRSTKALHDIDAEYQRQYSEEREEYDRQLEEYKGTKDKSEVDEPEAPSYKDVYITDATVEAIARSMQSSPGLTLVKDELSDWTENMSRYTNGNDVAHYLQMYSGGPIKINRASGVRIYIKDSYLNIIGGVQPDVARKVFDPRKRSDNGLLDRFGLIAYPERMPYRTPKRGPDTDLETEYRNACLKLHAQNWFEMRDTGDRPPYAIYSNEAQAAANEWFDRNGDDQAANIKNSVSGFMGKSRGTVSRLSFVINAFRVASGEDGMFSTIDLHSFQSAVRIYEAYCVPMYKRVLGEFGHGQEARSSTLLWEAVRRRGDKEYFSVSDITNLDLKGLKDKIEVKNAFEGLIENGYFYQKEREHGKGGRPRTGYWLTDAGKEAKKSV